MVVIPDEAITVISFLTFHSTLTLGMQVCVVGYAFILLMFVSPHPWC